MEWSFVFFLNSVLLGVGLAMDAFSVSMANGLHDPKMNKGTMCKIAGTFGIFQAAMPMIGWVCVHTIVELFASFETLIPWIALALLGYIGGKMLLDGIRGEEAEETAQAAIRPARRCARVHATGRWPGPGWKPGRWRRTTASVALAAAVPGGGEVRLRSPVPAIGPPRPAPGCSRAPG